MTRERWRDSGLHVLPTMSRQRKVPVILGSLLLLGVVLTLWKGTPHTLANSLEPKATANGKHVSAECGWEAAPVPWLPSRAGQLGELLKGSLPLRAVLLCVFWVLGVSLCQLNPPFCME